MIFRLFLPRKFILITCSSGTSSALNIYSFSGELLNTVSAYTGILGQRLAPVADLAMHPLKGVLAYGGIDGTVVLFESNVQRKSRTGLYREEGRSEYLAEGGVYQPLKVPDL